MNPLIIIGASGHGKVIADIAVKNGYSDIAFLDDNSDAVECAGFPVVGTVSDAEKYANHDFIVAIGNPEFRKKIQSSLSEYHVVTLIHPDAVISRRVEIGKGTVIMAGAVINSDTIIGEGCIINTCASVDHDNHIGDFVHVAVGAHLCGTVTIGNDIWIGAGATVSNNISICDGCFVGAGAVVVKDLKEQGTYIGVPVKKYENTDSRQL